MNIAATLSILNQYSRQTRIPLPAGLTADLATVAAIPSLEIDRDALARDVSKAVQAGKDPATVAAVQAHVTRWALAQLGIQRAIAEAHDRDRAELLVRYTPELVDAWAPAIRQAGEAIATITAAVPSLDLEDPAGGSQVPHHLVAAWRTARDGIATIGDIVTMWAILTGEAADMRNRPLVVAGLTAHQLDSLGYRPKPWRAATLAPLNLATPQVYRDRVAAIARDRDVAALRADQELRSKVRSSIGMG